ncbi:MAG TPA: PKD domain-containing protein, partial [Flavobacteriales bacterium]|nr:PKD domain-containing protein [Flavobacteriales bacterium]
ITDANGCIWVSEGITIGNNGPVASIIGAPESVLVNTPVNFESGSATGEYFWSFGDGASSTEQNPTHTFTVPGTYTVVLSVTDGLCSDVSTTDITVEL